MPPAQALAPPPLRWWQQAWRFAIALFLSVVSWALVADGLPSGHPHFELWLMIGDLILGVASFGAVAFRRRWPVQIALAVSLASTVSAAASGATALALACVATRRRPREIVAVGLTNLVCGLLNGVFYPRKASTSPWWVDVVISALVVSVIVAVGYAVGSRRELVTSLRVRAETAEREQQARVAQAREAERTRIAREMHDVLAHRISLVALHAGALNYRHDLSAEQRDLALATIEQNAKEALTDLREVLGVLRDPAAVEDAARPEAPQPRLDDLAALVENARAAGQLVELVDARSPGEVPEGIGRAAYRVVQEGVTNAVKHAPGSHVAVRVSGGPGADLVVRVSDTGATRLGSTAVPGSGLGLVGLGERVSLAGGRLRHGSGSRGGYWVEARLPWPA